MRQKTNEAMLAHARAMRSAPTPFEQKLWHALRAKRFNGVKFGRQVVIGPYSFDSSPARANWLLRLMATRTIATTPGTNAGRHG
nr:DUF559 domain-containing protein [Sphingomonas sp. CCH18-H6]